MTPKCPPVRTRERGFALLIVLWALVGLSLLTTMVITGAGSALRETRLLRQATQMDNLAQGGIETAIFQESGPIGTRWPLDGTVHLEKIDGFSVAITVQSEASRVNPNTAPLALLSALLQECGASAGQAQDAAREMIIWRRQSQSEDTGERQRYLSLGLGYRPPHAPFQTIDEIALVPGVTKPLLACFTSRLSVAQPEELHAPVTDPVVKHALARAGIPALMATTPDHALSFVVTVRVSDGQGGAASRRATILIATNGTAPSSPHEAARIISLSSP